jgi:hypothetical protein
MKKQGLLKQSPMPCNFKVGDKVTYTNDFGVVWKDMVVIGFSDDPDSCRKYGRFVHTDFLPKASHHGAAWWAPCSPDSLALANQARKANA